MSSRERVTVALEHEEPDRVPLDLGGSPTTGMHVSTVYALRQALNLDPPGTPVKVVEPFQMLGEIAPDLQEALGVDVVGLNSETNMFGFKNRGWKPWRLFDGTPVLVPEGFNTKPNEDGSIFMYPCGDPSASPCARMPKDGFYFDALDRQRRPVDWKSLDVEENLEEFGPISREELEFFRREAERLYFETDKAILANFGGTSFGDVALVPGLSLRDPRGIRGVKEWYICHVRRPDFIYRVFEAQCEIALENLRKLYKAVGNRVTAVFVTGTDFGTQRGPVMSIATYRKLYKPFHKRVNDWIHENTSWKTFIHSCGSIEPLIPEFIDAGFDILNPVQTSAANMDPRMLKRKYGEKITFWGGGIDTQHTLPFGTPKEVRSEVRERIRIFAPGGGYVFNTIHNVQPRIPVENVLAMYRALRDFGEYPIR
ncbi:methyltransferase [Candidatus Bathyarchaeota archaeon]|nr:MAG: methyltransferase [Candidatus Bathyarchaeota archaeon]